MEDLNPNESSQQVSVKPDYLTVDPNHTTNSSRSTSCFVEIIEKSNSCMEVEQVFNFPPSPVRDDSGIAFWQLQKLPGLKEEMKKLYSEGLPMFEVKGLDQEKIAELVGKIDSGDVSCENNKDILIRLLSEKIENSRDNQSELARKCKEYMDSLSTVFQGQDENFYMDLICNGASLKSYLNFKINYLENFVQNSSDYEVWEIKNTDFLKEIGEISQINFVKAQRKWKTKALNALDRLIKSIKKLKTADDVKKVLGLKDKYEEVLASKKTEMTEKTPKKSAAKRKHQTLEEPVDNELKVTEEEASVTTKKVKVTPAKTTPAKVTPVKGTLKKAEGKVSATKSVGEAEVQEGGSETKKGKETAKKEKKDNNQSNLMSFFKKKQVESSESKVENKMIPEAQTSRFKCLGAREVKSKWEADRAEAFERVLNGEESQPSVSELLELAKRSEVKSVTGKEASCRKIFISIHDSMKRIKGKYEVVSSKVTGRNPLAKDEVIIDYEIDSEDELQEQNAENIDEEGRSDNDESDLEEEKEVGFIVPDGYVSADEKQDTSDNEDNEETETKKNIVTQFKEDLDFKSKPKAFYFNMIEDYKPGKDMQLDDYLNKFKVIKLVDEEFPLKPKKAQEVVHLGGKTKLNPEAINDDDVAKALVLSIHGDFSKQDTIININASFPSCSKKSIETRIKELEKSGLIKRDKVPGENKIRWIAQKEYFLKFSSEEEYNKILVEKREKEAEKVRLEKEKRDNEKKLRLMSQTGAAEPVEVKKGSKENQGEDEMKENSNDKTLVVKKVKQTELSFGQTKVASNVEKIEISEGNSGANKEQIYVEHVFGKETLSDNVEK